jgi:hypothetical protein
MHVYGVIREVFHKSGRLLRTIGNHDEPLRKESVLEGLQTIYDGVDIHDYIFITPTSPPRTPLVVVTHGHQFDAWNNKSCGSMAGEVITEVVSGLGTIWGPSSWAAGKAADLTPRATWMRKLTGQGFPNELEDLTVDTFFGSAQSVDEVELYELMNEAFPRGRGGPDPYPFLILGHTHEPRHSPARPGGGSYDKYTNSGTAGRYEGLLWSVEIIDAEPELHIWYHADNGELVDQVMVAADDKLVAA